MRSCNSGQDVPLSYNGATSVALTNLSSILANLYSCYLRQAKREYY